MRRHLVPVFVAVLALLAGVEETRADTLETASRVTNVTIFSDRALVTRSAKLHVPAGAHTVSITNMPAGLDKSTLRVQGKAEGSVKIGSVEVKHIFLTEQANAAEREKTAAIEAKTDEKTMLEGEIAALETREDFINRVVSGGADKHDTNLSKLDFAPEKWAQAWTLVQNGMAETQKELTAKNIALRKLTVEIAKLQEELNQVRTGQSKEQRNANVNVEAAQDTELQLSLTYQTTGAVWRPVYDARLDTGSGALDLEQYGQVSQQTGEDWNDIDLTFSTAQPASGSEMPRMSEWLVKLLQPVAMLQAAPGYLAKAKNMVMEAQRAMPASASMAVDALKDVKEEEATIQEATVQATEYAAEFHVPGHASLKSVRDMSKLFIGTVHMKASLASQVSPRLTPQAYLFAKATNGEEYPLIPGIVSKYRDGAFIGNAALTMLRPGETANLSFGVDDRVKVTYQRTNEEQSNPTLVVVGDMKVERQYQAKIQNLHKDPITITVFEQYPIAGDADIKAELLDDVTTPGYVKDPDNRQGVITWSGSYKPKEEKTFTIGFRVKYPKDKQVIGL